MVNVREDFSDLQEQVVPLLRDLKRAQVRFRHATVAAARSA